MDGHAYYTTGESLEEARERIRKRLDHELSIAGSDFAKALAYERAVGRFDAAMKLQRLNVVEYVCCECGVVFDTTIWFGKDAHAGKIVEQSHGLCPRHGKDAA